MAGDAAGYFIALAAMNRPEAYPADIAAEALAMVEPVVEAWALAAFASYRNEPDQVAARVKPAERQFLALPHRLNGLYLKPGKALDTMVSQGGALRRTDCQPARCGDGVGDDLADPDGHGPLAGEECDDAGDSTACDSDCTLRVCGDEYVNAAAGEECDDGNTANGDGCDSNCRAEHCGDGIVQPNEECGSCAR